jgi:hypothetical protein
MRNRRRHRSSRPTSNSLKFLALLIHLLGLLIVLVKLPETLQILHFVQLLIKHA